MSDIKLRAWDGKRFVYFTPFTLIIDSVEGEGLLDNISTLYDLVRKDPDFKFDRFTGLKDKDGVEIYEGDIVRATKNWPGKGSQAFISTFRDNTATFAFREAFTNGDGEKYFYDALQVSGIEVIGNIHENPELLEVTS